MPRHPTSTPPAAVVFAALDRPPWHAWSSMEMADTLGVPLNWLWNHVMRGTSPEPDPPGLHTRASNRRFFNVSVVLAWLSEREGHLIEPWQWCRTWLAARSLIGPDATAGEVLAAIRAIDRAGVYRRRWRVQKELYDSRLSEILIDNAMPDSDHRLDPGCDVMFQPVPPLPA